ncbi:MAG: hypothetical protein GX418_06925 [Clostridiales bacterium]|nr:hypothetical protein [Clostridiales bacterium]
MAHAYPRMAHAYPRMAHAYLRMAHAYLRMAHAYPRMAHAYPGMAHASTKVRQPRVPRSRRTVEGIAGMSRTVLSQALPSR